MPCSPPPESASCPCGAALPPRAARGPARRFCSPACRSRASRARRDVATGDLVPLSPPEPVAAFLVGREADPDAQVVAAVQEAMLLATSLRRLGTEARGGFRYRCAGLADVLDDGLRRYFPV